MNSDQNKPLSRGKSTGLGDVVKEYLDSSIHRREFFSRLTGLGLTAGGARAVAQTFEGFASHHGEESGEPLPDWAVRFSGTGAEALIRQLISSNQKHLFVNPSSSAYAIFDALVGKSELHIIKAVQEGALAAMADGYARASGTPALVLIARLGLPNAMTQMYNAWKDRIPMIVATDIPSRHALGQDHFEEVEDIELMAAPLTKWHWRVEQARKIPETLRRALKFCSTVPAGPAFISLPSDILSEDASTLIYHQKKASVPMRIEAAQFDVERVAKMLTEASNPLLYVGDEVTQDHANREVIELAEVLGLPVSVYSFGGVFTWSKPFPNRHPLYLGPYQPTARQPGKVDLMLNLGSRMPLPVSGTLQITPNTKLIQVRRDPENLARSYPTDLPIVADLKTTSAAIVENVRRMVSPRKLKRVREDRVKRIKAYTAKMRAARRRIAQSRWNNEPLSIERLIVEIESAAASDACIVAELDSAAAAVDEFMEFSVQGKHFFSNSGAALGWALPAAFGVKLARAEHQVVAIVSDGGFLFSGPQPLWTYVRHEAPIIVIVVNNRSYNQERNRIWTKRGRQYQTGRDMVCYLGDPDVNYAKLAEGVGVEGEVVEKPDAVKGALQRAMRATDEGRPYLIDAIVERRGSGAQSTWYPRYSVREISGKNI